MQAFIREGNAVLAMQRGPSARTTGPRRDARSRPGRGQRLLGAFSTPVARGAV